VEASVTKDQLIESARKLGAATLTATADYEARREAMAAELSRRMLARQDIDRLIGPDNREMLENNSRNMFRFMGSLFRSFDPQVLAETALWVFRAYRSHGFQISYWPANLDTAVQILREQLSAESFDSVYPPFEWLIVHNPAFVELSDAALEKEPSAMLNRVPDHG
jgi:hypothetical protein